MVWISSWRCHLDCRFGAGNLVTKHHGHADSKSSSADAWQTVNFMFAPAKPVLGTNLGTAMLLSLKLSWPQMCKRELHKSTRKWSHQAWAFQSSIRQRRASALWWEAAVSSVTELPSPHHGRLDGQILVRQTKLGLVRKQGLWLINKEWSTQRPWCRFHTTLKVIEPNSILPRPASCWLTCRFFAVLLSSGAAATTAASVTEAHTTLTALATTPPSSSSTLVSSTTRPARLWIRFALVLGYRHPTLVIHFVVPMSRKHVYNLWYAPSMAKHSLTHMCPNDLLLKQRFSLSEISWVRCSFFLPTHEMMWSCHVLLLWAASNQSVCIYECFLGNSN